MIYVSNQDDTNDKILPCNMKVPIGIGFENSFAKAGEIVSFVSSWLAT